jgi:hypothetical protein
MDGDTDPAEAVVEDIAEQWYETMSRVRGGKTGPASKPWAEREGYEQAVYRETVRQMLKENYIQPSDGLPWLKYRQAAWLERQKP